MKTIEQLPRGGSAVRWALGLAATVLLAAGMAAAGDGDEAGSSIRAGLLPDVGESPRMVTVVANSARRAMLRNADLIANLVNGLPDSTRFLVLTNDRAAFVVTGREQPERVRFLELPFTSPLTIWPQDPFLVLTDGDETILLTSRKFERADDRLMAPAIAADRGYRLATSALSFEGGNIVADQERVFIGANTIRRNAIELGVGEVEVVLRFETELGRPVTVVGPTPQPVAHLDMMLTPLGDGRLAVADTGAGADLAERALVDDPDQVRSFESWCENHFFGRPAIRELDGLDGPIRAPELEGGTARMIDSSRRIAPVLDGIASSLIGAGFRVERVPLLDGGPIRGEHAAFEMRPTMRAAYPILTYNNVLLADTNGRRSVYLPRYGFDPLDRAAEQTWRSMGFEVHAIEGLAISAMYGGALRCTVKVLERSSLPRGEPLPLEPAADAPHLEY